MAMSTLRPGCCHYDGELIKLMYANYIVDNQAYFLIHPPLWHVHNEPAKFCPFCGIRFPELRLKKVFPEKIMTITDGGYYCDTCAERLHACECARPTEMWEIKT